MNSLVKKTIRSYVKRGAALLMCMTLLVMQCVNRQVFAKSLNISMDDEYGATVIETGKFIKQGSKIDIKGKIVETDKLPKLHDGISGMLQEESQIYSNNYFYQNNQFHNQHSIYSKKSIEIHTSETILNNVIYAKDDIQINCADIKALDYTILYSQNGNIYINTSQMQYTGLLYAPNGKVVINGTNIDITGAVISEKTEMYGSKIQILGVKETEKIYQALSHYKNDAVVAVAAAVNEDNSIYINLESNIKLESSDIYVRRDNESQFCYLETITATEYELKNLDFKETIDITVVGHTLFGDKADATIVTVGYDMEDAKEGGEEKELCTLKHDSDKDGIADGVEIWYLHTNPYEADTDHDGFDDYAEAFYLYTDPNVYTEDSDFDKDGLWNKQELMKQTNPYLKDSDFDGEPDSRDDNPWRFNEQEEYTEEKNGEADYTEEKKTGIFDRQGICMDAQGNCYQYGYNFINDNIQYITEEGKTTKYYYDLEEKLTAVVVDNEEASYAIVYRYENGQIAGISRNGMNYDIEKKQKAIHQTDEECLDDVIMQEETSDIYIAQKLYKHSETKQNLQWEQYGNQDKFEYCYNSEGCLEKIYENNHLVYSFDYENKVVKSIYNHKNNVTYHYQYDKEQNLKQISDTLGNQINYEYSEDYYKITYEIEGKKKIHTIYYQAAQNNVQGYSTKLISGAGQMLYSDNDNQKIKEIQEKNGVTIKTVYTMSESNITEIAYQNKDTEKYVYTKENKLSEIYQNGQLKLQYKYDKKGQLVEEHNPQVNQSYYYTYDKYGNITSKKCCEYHKDKLLSEQSLTYGNGWTDQVKTIDGELISYDAIGNPVNYIQGMNMQWTGRRLDNIQTPNNAVSYTYNEEGIRNSKTVNGIATSYVLEGQDIICEKTEDNVIWYMYDGEMKVTGFVFNDKVYYYEKNAQNDVTALLNQRGERVCSYTYDAWGNLVEIQGDENAAKANKYRYRSYYYDEETGFYYLKNRYYDSRIGRFINADFLEKVYQDYDNLNLYLYCNNDPVNQVDPNGNAPVTLRIFTSKKAYNDYPNEWNSFRSTCTLWINYMKKGGDVKNNFISKKSDFVQKWNDLNSPTGVIIYFHGNPQSLLFDEESESMSTAEITSKLKRKSIKFVWLLSCNTGHYSYKWSNVANALAQKVSGVVVAPDGDVENWLKKDDIYKKKVYAALACKTPKGWEYWKREAKDNTFRNNGWFIYKNFMTYNRLYSTNLKTSVTIFELSDYLVKSNLIVYK